MTRTKTRPRRLETLSLSLSFFPSFFLYLSVIPPRRAALFDLLSTCIHLHPLAEQNKSKKKNSAQKPNRFLLEEPGNTSIQLWDQILNVMMCRLWLQRSCKFQKWNYKKCIFVYSFWCKFGKCLGGWRTLKSDTVTLDKLPYATLRQGFRHGEIHVRANFVGIRSIHASMYNW